VSFCLDCLIIQCADLHSCGYIKYFGNIKNTISSVTKFKQENPLCSSTREETTYGLEVIDNTVFISSHWVIDTLKGLIRHDRASLLEWFRERFPDKSNRMMWTMRVLRLQTHGLLHEELLPYVWPQSKESQ
jgi:hypothetical protein